jgi:hypothetical protein
LTVSLQERYKVIPMLVGAGMYQRVERYYIVYRDTIIV